MPHVRCALTTGAPRVRSRSPAGWSASSRAYVALQLVWPTPFGIVVWGVVLSSLSALLALGLVLVYRSHRVINFAQADLGAVPATLAVCLVTLSGWSYWVAVPARARGRRWSSGGSSRRS